MRRGWSFYVAIPLLSAACSHQPSSTLELAPTPSATQVTEVFRAPPGATLDTSKEISRIAFGSCADPKKPQPLWRTIEQTRPQLFLATGDNVYASRPEDKPIAKMYRMQMEIPEYVRFRQQTPILATWDDHDYGQQDGGADNPEKEQARQDFLNFYHNDAQLLTSESKGLAHSVIVGPAGRRVQILMLDTRFFRSPLEKNQAPKNPLDIYQPTQDSTKTILGSEQWDWLAKELSRPAELRLLVTSIQFIATEHGFEKWANFPHERERLLKLLKDRKIRNLALISGDRHAGEISRMPLTKQFQLIDVTASGINRTSTLAEESNRFRVGARHLAENFGLATIDWKNSKVLFELRDLEGKPITTATLRF